jgi:hypothetical protein
LSKKTQYALFYTLQYYRLENNGVDAESMTEERYDPRYLPSGGYVSGSKLHQSVFFENFVSPGSIGCTVKWLAWWPLVPKIAGSNPAEAVEKILSMPSFGGEVKPSVPCRTFAACKRSLHLPWKSHAVGKMGSAISRPYFSPSLIEVSNVAGRGAPLEMTGETKCGAQWARS